MAGDPDAGAASDEDRNDNDPSEETHTAVLFDGTLPGPNGSVPSIIHETSIADQRQHADDLYTMITDPTISNLELNDDPVVRVAMINVPRTDMIRIVYGFGFGSAGIGRVSPLAGKFLCLHGDGDADAPAATCLLPAEAGIPRANVRTMSYTQFNTQLTAAADPTTLTYPILPRNQITETSTIMQLAPIPAYLVYDGFQQHLSAALVYERILSTADHMTNATLQHAKHFLRACLGAHNAADPKPFIANGDFMAHIHT